jgi:putative phosphoribosyl transferase
MVHPRLVSNRQTQLFFRDRAAAGRLLAQKLADTHRHEDAVVYALPRGGVVLGVEIAKRLQAPLDLVLPRKVGHPAHQEYAVCAVTEKGYVLCNQEEVSRLDPDWLKKAIQKELAEARRRRQAYLGDKPDVPVKGKMAIITDDGIATGLTMLAAIQEVKSRQPAKIIVAVPVVPQGVVAPLQTQVDELVALGVPVVFRGGVGAYYERFEQVSDEEVRRLLVGLRPTAIEER